MMRWLHTKLPLLQLWSIEFLLLLFLLLSWTGYRFILPLGVDSSPIVTSSTNAIASPIVVIDNQPVIARSGRFQPGYLTLEIEQEGPWILLAKIGPSAPALQLVALTADTESLIEYHILPVDLDDEIALAGLPGQQEGKVRLKLTYEPAEGVAADNQDFDLSFRLQPGTL